jgi:hypothetical protein
MYSDQQKYLLMFKVSVFLMLTLTSGFVFAQSEDFATVASPVQIEGNVNDHDIVSYGIENNVYRASRSFADESMFGVVVDDPVLYMDSETARTDDVRPVVRYGEVLVNVSNLGGEIKAGNLITTSIISGVGQRTEMQDAPYILGFALEDMTPNGNSFDHEGKEVLFGTVPITLRIGPFLTKEGIDFISSGQDFESYVSEITKSNTLSNVVSNTNNASAFKVFRYILATVVAVTSLIVSITRFGDTFKQGVISIGRNPLARSQIRSIMIWDVLLVVLVTVGGFGVATAIILFP